MRSPTCIVPMKPLTGAKSRLRKFLDDDSREALSLLMLAHVLSAVGDSGHAAETTVIGGDAVVRAVAEERGALWAPDPGGGLNVALRAAGDEAFGAGAPAVLVLPSDLALLAIEDLDLLVESSRGLSSVVLARAPRDSGTNAILAPRGMLLGPSFGPGSFDRHMGDLRRAGLPVEVVDTPGLAFDVDTEADVHRYFAERPDTPRALEGWRARLAAEARVTPDAER